MGYGSYRTTEVTLPDLETATHLSFCPEPLGIGRGGPRRATSTERMPDDRSGGLNSCGYPCRILVGNTHHEAAGPPGACGPNVGASPIDPVDSSGVVAIRRQTVSRVSSPVKRWSATCLTETRHRCRQTRVDERVPPKRTRGRYCALAPYDDFECGLLVACSSRRPLNLIGEVPAAREHLSRGGVVERPFR